MRQTLRAGKPLLLAISFVAFCAHATPIVFDETGALQSFTVSTTGLYDISAMGAQGGSAGSTPIAGGFGADLSGQIFLTAGTQLEIAVGAMGSTGSFTSLYGGGGGGGSFVYVFGASSPLLVAGGGGGSGYSGNPGGNAQTSSSGQAGSGSDAGAGGTGGSGGQPGSRDSYDGAGGGGWSGNGGDASGTSQFRVARGGGGATGFAGGDGDCATSGPVQCANGGYGGGGGGGWQGGGGGGGYSGGGGGDGSGSFAGGGGGSFMDAAFMNGFMGLASNGGNNGNGQVSIELVGDVGGTPVPEPDSLWLVGLSLSALYFARRRQ
ncbi:MAG: PEP-CTERM sorting domain-containing protein [Paucibacter sp.]|nr:PEP-CTERM sorting domain-containing protein [Roseateles sp.]